MFRAVLACAVVLLSGCVASTPAAPVQDGPVVDDDGMVVTATRVEALVHPVDHHGVIEARSCLMGDDTCPNPLMFDWPTPTSDFGDPLALFWRVALHADWTSNSLVSAMRMTVYATKPCGLGCIDEREIQFHDDAASPGFDSLEVYLREGETGVRVRLEPLGNPETSLSEARVEYHLHGAVGGYRPAGDPVIIG